MWYALCHEKKDYSGFIVEYCTVTSHFSLGVVVPCVMALGKWLPSRVFPSLESQCGLTVGLNSQL